MDTRHRILLALAAALLITCKGGDGITSPTAPSGLTAFVGGALGHASFQPSLQRIEVFLDNSRVADTSASPAQVAIGFEAQRSISSGRHTLRIRVSSQTTSPNQYTTSGVGVFVFEGLELRKQIELPNRTATLRTGESIDYTFDV